MMSEDVNEVRDGEHAHKRLSGAVPQRSGSEAVGDQRKEGLLYLHTTPKQTARLMNQHDEVPNMSRTTLTSTRTPYLP